MTTALERGEGSASRASRSLPLGKTRYPLYRRLGGPQGRSGQVRKISPPPGFDPRTVQPLASRYTDWTTRPTYYVYCTVTEVFLNLTEVFLTLTEVFPCFFLSCKANARVKLAKTGHGPHSTTLVCICVVRMLLFVLFCCYLCCSMYCLCVNVYCHWVTTQLQLINK